VEHLPHRTGRDLVAQPGEFALDAAMPPGRVLVGQTQDQRPQLRIDRGPPSPGVRVGPIPGQQLAVPAQQRGRGDEERRPAGAGQQPGQGREHEPVFLAQLGAVDLAAQDRDLVSQDE
jgi:hypothetical protein